MITIFCGKSACGKDSLMRELVKEGYEPIISYTSRPMREGEINGREYHFCDMYDFQNMIRKNEMIEFRSYNTLVNGVPDTWYYGLKKQDFDKKKDYIVILDLKGTEDLIRYVGAENCFVCYVDADKDIRTERAKRRGSFNEQEWTRRLAADEKDFPEEKVCDLADYRITNEDTLEDALKEYKEAYRMLAERENTNADHEKILIEIRDAVKNYYGVIEEIHNTYTGVLKDLNETKDLVEENRQLREENTKLKEELDRLKQEREEEYERD